MKQSTHTTTPRPSLSSWALAWQFARREIRGSIRRFRVFLGALLLGVAAIGTVGSVAESMRSGIGDNARILLGGDIEFSSLHTPPDNSIVDLARNFGAVSQVVQMRAMLQTATARKLVELKAVDSQWPLVGNSIISPDIGLTDSLANNAVIADPSLLRSLGLAPGDSARLGDLDIRVSAELLSEPDRSISFVSFGPRVLISQATLQATGLQQPGSFITYRYRLILNNETNRQAALTTLRNATSDTHVRVRDLADAAPGFDRFINQAEVFLVLVGLTALLIGGLGVAGAVRAWLASRIDIIATLKCVGAPARLIFRIYLLQVMCIASIGVSAGVVVAAIAPLFAIQTLAGYVTVPLDLTIYPVPLLVATGFGLGTAYLFAVWPLAKAEEVRAADLFRRLVAIPEGRPTPAYLLSMLVAAGGLALLALIATRDIKITSGFIGGSLAALLLLSILGHVLVMLLRRMPRPGFVPVRLAISNIIRPGSPVRSVIIAFGLGLSVLVTVSLSEANLGRQIDSRLADDAPDWFFIDIQPHQIDEFEQTVATIDGISETNKTPMLRGRVVRLDDVPVLQITPDEGSAWILRGDRALTWSATPPKGSKIVAGNWWDTDYNGPPLVSMSFEAANDFGLTIGDTVTINVLGREITATIVNLRAVDWESFSINFVFVLNPGVLDAAPHSWIATTHADDAAAADAVERAITSQFSNVSAISVKEAVATAQQVIALLGGAIRLTALVTLIAGIAVLVGTVASSEAQRLADSVILKVLGATRLSIGLAWFFEYALLGLLTAIAAACIGTIASWALVAQLLEADFEFNGWLVLATTLGGALLTAVLGLISAMQTLGRKPAPVLREL
jgi:putative ABC transport system permease protein